MSAPDQHNARGMKNAVTASRWLGSDFSLTPSLLASSHQSTCENFSFVTFDSPKLDGRRIDEIASVVDRSPAAAVQLTSKVSSLFQRLLSPCRVCLGHGNTAYHLENASTCESKESSAEIEEHSSIRSSRALTQSTVVSDHGHDDTDEDESPSETSSEYESPEEDVDWFCVSAAEGNTDQETAGLDVSQEVISRSTLFRETLLDATEEDAVTVPLPPGVLEHWLQGLVSMNLIEVPSASQPDAWRVAEGESLVKVLHVRFEAFCIAW